MFKGWKLTKGQPHATSPSVCVQTSENLKLSTLPCRIGLFNIHGFYLPGWGDCVKLDWRLYPVGWGVVHPPNAPHQAHLLRIQAD